MKRFVTVMMVALFVLGLTINAALAAGPIQTAAEAYFAGGLKTIKAADLFANLNDGDASNNPMIIDLRAPEDHANGYIPGAVNIGITKLFTAEQLAKLPKNKPIVIYCYSGQTSAQATAALRLMGYDAYSLLYGVASWGVNDKVKYPFTAAQSGNYPVSKEPAQLTGNFAAPKELGDTAEAAAIAYFSGGAKLIKAADVFANLNDGDTGNDPVLIDVRSPEDYALGHIPGAANVPVKNFFTAENLAKLPSDKQIVVYCYTGQSSGHVVAALRMLGYNAFSMAFGMPSWAIVEGVSVPVWDISKSGNYPLEVAAAPVAARAPAALPTTGMPVALALTLVGIALAGAGLTLRKR